MIILDTDVITHLRKRNELGILIAAWLDASSDQETWITVVTAHEIRKAAVSLVEQRRNERDDLVSPFFRLEECIVYLASWREHIVSYDANADRIYRGFPPRLRQEIKNDSSIAAVALAHGAAAWTSNLRDYARVPGLLVFDARTGLKVS